MKNLYSSKFKYLEVNQTVAITPPIPLRGDQIYSMSGILVLTFPKNHLPVSKKRS